MTIPKDAILIGSCFFFSSYPDFKPHDTDYLYVVDECPFPFIKKQNWRRFALRGQGIDLIYLQRKTKEEYLQESLTEQNLPLILGKFLIPQFAQLIELTIDDLSRLKPLVDQLDTKHKYEAIIYNAYLENHDFTITQEQLDLAYQSYIETRKKGE